MKYSLGLDIGTTSIGWAVVNEDKKRIEECGVRIFEKPENPKNGQSLTLPRRTARSARRRLNRRRQRLDFLKTFFVEKNLLTKDEIENILAPEKEPKIEPYVAREKSLTQKLTNEELFASLYHIAKRRGYKSNRKSVEEKDPEGSKVLSAISENKELLASHKTKSIAKVLNEDNKFTSHRRNKSDDYNNSFIREDFLAEIQEILNRQHKMGLNLSEEDINDLLWRPNRGLFYQRPFITAELINKMRGNCPFEKSEPRAQKASYTFELFRLVQDLSHLEYNDGNKLTPEQIENCIEKSKNTAKVTYKSIKEVLGYKNDTKFKFDYIRGPQQKFKKDGDKKIIDESFDPLSSTFSEMKFYHAVKKALKDSPKDWCTVENDSALFDNIGYILTANKDDENIEKELKNLKALSNNAIKNLMPLNFSGFGHLSLKALQNITPYLLKGETYDKAVELAYPGQFAGKLSGDLSKLPPLDEDEQNQITNPVVKRAISQVNKVVNAIIAKYGAPTQIKLEAANDLAKNFRDRTEIKKAQDENAANNEKIKERLTNEFGVTTPTGLQITKFKLYNDQNGKCLYCSKTIDLNMLFSDEHYCEIDHIIPYSRCGNDSKVNLALVHNSHNQEKKNQTPFEAWGNDSTHWRKFTELACAIYTNEKHPKRIRLLSEKAPDESWNIRALNDTRYLNKFLSQRFRKHLKFSDDRETGTQKVLTPNGKITASLRRIYGISKSREENNLHHAADACVLATVSQGTIQDFANWNKWRELNPEQKIERPEPWEEFGKEVRLRTSELKPADTVATYREQFRNLYKNQDDQFRANISPIFVSRMPKRNGTGATNKETIRSPKVKDGGQRTIRKRLSDIKLADLDKSALPESDKVLYDQLKSLLEANNNDPKKAFEKPVYKNHKTHDKNGRPLMPVSTIKVYTTDPDRSGFYINDGKGFVNNGGTVRLDIFKRKSVDGTYKFFAAPIYVHLLHSNNVPILPTPVGRSAADKADFNKLKNPDSNITASAENGFELICSVYPNDYLRMVYDKSIVEGYYVKYGIANGTLSLIAHSQASKSDLDMIHCSLGSALAVRKIDISVLGDNYKWS